MPSSDSSRDALLERLAEEFVERHRRGEHPALAEYADRNPDLAAEIRDLFPALVRIEHLKPVAGDLTGKFVSESGREEEHITERLGDYRILRQVGQGGMGVVYEAEQESLGRHVALKVLPRQALVKGTYRERFRREAKAAAKLHHTNIVPVFGVGECDGTHYYAMQFIPGESLDKVLGDLRRLRAAAGSPATAATQSEASAAHSLLTGRFAMPPAAAAEEPSARPAPPAPAADGAHGSSTLSTSGPESHYFRGIARLAVQVADALAYAHRQGVLHRDIKPSNLLLDQQGTVWITDFGLAKAEGADDLTQSGDIVGTLRFMAPERFDGESLPQSDVYGLGATLYELLTLRPAFDDTNRARLVERVLHEPPVLPRKIEPGVPRDLETIVLKCLAKEPALRYATAERLAEDLRRFLADQPIKARRAGNAERTWRWCRRNPAGAGLIVTAALFLALLAIGLPLSLLLRAQRNTARENLERAMQAERELKLREDEIAIRSHLALARAHRLSGAQGQRYQCLDEIARAMALRPPEPLRRELRDEAVAALALVDVRPVRAIDMPPGARHMCFDQDFTQFAWVDRQGDVCLTQLRKPLPPEAGPGGWSEGAGRSGIDTPAADSAITRRIAGVGPIAGFGYRGFSTDARFLAIFTERNRTKQTVLWDLQQWKQHLVLEGEFLGYLPDGIRAVTWVSLADWEVRIYDIRSGAEERRFRLRPGWHGLAISPDGRRLAVTGDNDALQLWDLGTGTLSQTVSALSRNGWVAWHPKGHLLAATSSANGEQVIRVWDVTGNRLQAEMRPPAERISGISFSPDGCLLLSSGWDFMNRFWDPLSGHQHLAFPGGLSYQNLFNRSGRLLGYSLLGSKMTIWEVAHPVLSRVRVGLRPTDGGTTSSLDFGMDERLLVLSAKNGLHLWDRAEGRDLAFLPLGENQAIWHPDGRSLITSSDSGLQNWPIRAERRPNDSGAEFAVRLSLGPAKHLADVGRYWAAELTADGRKLAAVQRNQQRAVVVDLVNGTQRRTTSPHRNARRAALSPDGKWLATATWQSQGQGTTKIWDARTGLLAAELPPDLIQGDATVFFSPDGRWLVTGQDAEFRTWQVGSWKPQRVFRRESGYSEGTVAFACEGRLMVINRNPELLELVDPATGHLFATLTVPDKSPICALRFSADGSQLAVGCVNQPAFVWDLRSVREGLAPLGLDWDLLPYPPPAHSRFAGPLAIHVDYPDPKAAIGTSSLALALNPFNWDAYYQRGRAYGALKQPVHAIADYSMFLTLAPPTDQRRPEVLFRRSNSFLTLNRRAESLADMLHIAQGRPDQFGTLAAEASVRCNNLAWQLANGPEKERDLDSAIRLIGMAVELQPDEATFWNTLGAVHYRSGRYQEAVAALERSLAGGQGQHDAFDLFFLAMCHAKLGDQAKAKERFDRAVKWVKANTTSLRSAAVQELDAFRAEAEATLRAP
jgi:serine/threonine protein kinase/WD40 repeat protein